jgi:hypothetical protein
VTISAWIDVQADNSHIMFRYFGKQSGCMTVTLYQSNKKDSIKLILVTKALSGLLADTFF